MKTVTVKMNVPEDVLVAARISKRYAASEFRKELAVHLFERGVLSFGKSTQLAGMSKWDFMSMLGSRKIALHYDAEDLDEDLKILGKLKLT